MGERLQVHVMHVYNTKKHVTAVGVGKTCAFRMSVADHRLKGVQFSYDVTDIED